jgi:hypothetical protein
MDVDPNEAFASLEDRELRALWAVGWVLERWLFDETCLRRSLASGWFIRRRRPVLRLGMIDDGGSIAHAWVEAQGRAFDSAAVTGTFASGATAPTFRSTRDPVDPVEVAPGPLEPGPAGAPADASTVDDLPQGAARADDGCT